MIYVYRFWYSYTYTYYIQLSADVNQVRDGLNNDLYRQCKNLCSQPSREQVLKGVEAGFNLRQRLLVM